MLENKNRHATRIGSKQPTIVHHHSHLEEDKGEGKKILYTEQACDQFQKMLNPAFIKKACKIFRESGNSEAGKVSKAVYKKVFKNQLNVKDEHLIEAIFERFRLEKSSERVEKMDTVDHKEDKEEIEIQDLVIALALLARIPEQEKLFLIFDLSDIDEDECLSADDINNMIVRIQKNFAFESCFIDPMSSRQLSELSLRKAQRKTWITVQGMFSKNDKEEDNDEEDKLKDWDDFIEGLEKKQYLKSKFLPNNQSLYYVLQNRRKEKELLLTKHSNIERDPDFDNFRKCLHYKIRSSYKDEYYKNIMKNDKCIVYPSKVKIQDDYVGDSQTKEVRLYDIKKIGKQEEFKTMCEQLDNKFKVLTQSEFEKHQEKKAKEEQELMMQNNNKFLTSKDNPVLIKRHQERLQKMKEQRKEWDLKQQQLQKKRQVNLNTIR